MACSCDRGLIIHLLTERAEMIIEQPEWYRKYWAPWGKAIGHHDVGYVEVNGRLFTIHRHENEGKVFFVPHNYTDGHGQCFRFEDWNDLVRWCEVEGQTSVACS